MIAPYYTEQNITIYNCDCRDVLPQLEKVDLVLTDPPYGLAEADTSKNDYASFSDKAEDVTDIVLWVIANAKADRMVMTPGQSQKRPLPCDRQRKTS